MEIIRKLPEIRVWANLLIREHGKILLLKRKWAYWDWTWCFPWWHMEEDDSIIDTVIRETEEEIGITINKKDLQLVTTSDRREWNLVYIQFLYETTFYTGTITNKEPNKAYELRFFDIKKLPENIFPPHISLILFLGK